MNLMKASLEVLKRDWFVLIPAVIYSLGFSLLSPNWVLKENLSNAEMTQLFSQLGLLLVVQLWVQLFTIRMILQVIKENEMALPLLLKGIFIDWIKLLFANALMFAVVIGAALALPGKNLILEVLRMFLFVILFILFTLLPVVMTFNQFSLVKSFQFFGRAIQKARREFLYLVSFVFVFKLLLFILAVQISFIPGLGRPLGVSLMDAFSLVITLIMMVMVIRPISILTRVGTRVSRKA